MQRCVYGRLLDAREGSREITHGSALDLSFASEGSPTFTGHSQIPATFDGGDDRKPREIASGGFPRE
jgi:hypothetical protein